MKIVKIVLGIVLAFITIFLLAGVFSPMVSYSTEIEVNKPVEEAWAVFMDESKMGLWMEGFKSIELLEGGRGRMGSKYKVIIEQGGKTMEMIENITDVKDNELFVLNIENDVLTTYLTVKFTPKDEQTTHISANSDVHGKGIFFRSLFFFMKSSFKKQDAEIYNSLKRVIEENTTDYFPAPVEENQ